MASEAVISTGTAIRESQGYWSANTTSTGYEVYDEVVPPYHLPSHRAVINAAQQKLRHIPNVQSVFVRRIDDVLEIYVVAELPNREQERAFYQLESELLQLSSPGTLSIRLVNLSRYENSPPFVPPKGANPLQLRGI